MHIHLEVTDQHGDDFLRDLVRVRVREGQEALVWSLPKRLMRNTAAAAIICEEIIAEFRERRGGA